MRQRSSAAFLLLFFLSVVLAGGALAQIPDENYPLFNDKLLIDGYARKLGDSAQETLIAMIDDNALAGYRKAAAVRVFRERFAPRLVSRDLAAAERVLLRQLERTASVYVQIELIHALLVLDRYRFFDSMVPALILKLDHYDPIAAEMSFAALTAVNASGGQRPREARIEFNTLRKMFFLSRQKLATADPGDVRLKAKLELLRWAVKVLGTEELKNLPKEVLSLM